MKNTLKTFLLTVVIFTIFGCSSSSKYSTGVNQESSEIDVSYDVNAEEYTITLLDGNTYVCNKLMKVDWSDDYVEPVFPRSEPEFEKYETYITAKINLTTYEEEYGLIHKGLSVLAPIYHSIKPAQGEYGSYVTDVLFVKKDAQDSWNMVIKDQHYLTRLDTIPYVNNPVQQHVNDSDGSKIYKISINGVQHLTFETGVPPVSEFEFYFNRNHICYRLAYENSKSSIHLDIRDHSYTSFDVDKVIPLSINDHYIVEKDGQTAILDPNRNELLPYSNWTFKDCENGRVAYYNDSLTGLYSTHMGAVEFITTIPIDEFKIIEAVDDEHLVVQDTKTELYGYIDMNEYRKTSIALPSEDSYEYLIPMDFPKYEINQDQTVSFFMENGNGSRFDQKTGERIRLDVM